ncbi:hypothetical protein [Undibacter mobilis]|uniref:Uncharacterized protein n=1 Tax=Undibacter mobilis TaxID=2292256 RepID=A0A371B0R6_9BRAD|nr:hypothetical protein [Undibacter mobilis]RDV01130.1 hypothetical protein DXH78_17990 [Undibacter mobilis]
MRTADHHHRSADNPPDIDELSARLAALANRIDTLNGGRRPPGARSGPAAAPRREPAASPAGDGGVRQWPRLPVPDEAPAPDRAESVPPARVVHMGDHEQRLAELTAARDRQATDLREAREHLERQALAIKSLRDLASERDAEVAELTRRLMESEADKVALESQLASALRDASNSSVRLAAKEGALNNQSADLADAQQLIDHLHAELAAAQVAVATQVVATEERIERRHELERSALIANTERRVADLQGIIAERDARLEALEQDKVTLAEEIAALRALLDDSHAEITAAIETAAGKDSHIAFLDTVINVTRENAEATVKELIAEFDRERTEFKREREALIAKAQTASAFQQDIAKLLPRLLERRAAAA